MKNKRGQFYIIAALIIVIIITGFAGLGTYAIVTPDPKTIQSLSKDLKQENPKIIDYGIYNEEDLNQLLTDFTGTEFAPYFLKKTDNANIVFIYGDKNNLKAVQYDTESTGTITANFGGSSSWIDLTGTYAKEIQIIPSGNEIEVTILNKIYRFNLIEGELFYFVMVQEKEDETYVERN